MRAQKLEELTVADVLGDARGTVVLTHAAIVAFTSDAKTALARLVALVRTFEFSIL
jgi:hypothetical protein